MPGETDGDRLYGRGSTDMKSGIAAFIFAALNLCAAPEELAGLDAGAHRIRRTGLRRRKVLGWGEVARPRWCHRGGRTHCEPAPTLAQRPAVGGNRNQGQDHTPQCPNKVRNALLKMNQIVSRIDNFDWKHHCGTDCHHVMGKPTMNIATFNLASIPTPSPTPRVTVDMRTVPGIDHAHHCRSLETLIGPLGTMKKSSKPAAVFGTGRVDRECFRRGASIHRPTPAALHHHVLHRWRGFAARLWRRRAHRHPRSRRTLARASNRRVVLGRENRSVGGNVRAGDSGMEWDLSELNQIETAIFAANPTRNTTKIFSTFTGNRCASLAPRVRPECW